MFVFIVVRSGLKNEYDSVEETILINDYLFFNNGEMANITHYTETNKTTFTFMDNVVTLK